jgi:hypothetical protein
LLDAGLTGTGPFAKLFGLAGKDGAVGGLFGGIADALGLGGGLETANIKAGVVNVIGGSSALGGIGGSLSEGASGLMGSLGSLFSGLFSVFDEGGVVGALGGRMMRAPLSAFVGAPHFASGGAVPVIAHAGEVILNAAQQANVAAAIKAAGAASNHNVAGGRASAAAAPIVNHFHFPPGTDAGSFRQSEGQIAAMVARALGSAQRNL